MRDSGDLFVLPEQKKADREPHIYSMLLFFRDIC